MGAATDTAKPEMLHRMSIGRFVADRMILRETKQSALPIVKGRLTSRVCTERKHGNLIAATGRKSATGHESRLHVDLRMFRIPQAFRLLSLESSDRSLQPSRHGSLHFFLRPCTVKKIDRFSLLVQGNVTARNLLAPRILRDELHQDAITAWLWRLGAVGIQTGLRILKHKLRAPRGPRGVMIATLLQKLQFGLQHVQ